MVQEPQREKRNLMTDEELKKKRELSKMRMLSLKHHIFVCNGGCCRKNAAAENIVQCFKEVVDEFGIADVIRITPTSSCIGRCADACSVVIYPEGTWYKQVTPEVVHKIIKEHLIEGCKLESNISFTYENGKFIENI